MQQLAVELVQSEEREQAWMDASDAREARRVRLERDGGKLPWLFRADEAIDTHRQIESYQARRRALS